MKRFINSRISKKGNLGFVINLCIIAVSAISLLLILSSNYTSNTFVSAVLVQAAFLSLVYLAKRYYDKNGGLNLLEKSSLVLSATAFTEMLLEFFGRGMFSIFFVVVPFIYAYFGRPLGIISLVLIGAIEFTLLPEISTFFKIIVLAVTTIIFGSYIKTPLGKSGYKKPDLPKLSKNSSDFKITDTDSTNYDYIKIKIKESLENLRELLPHNSIVLYLKNDEGLYEIFDFISNDEDLIDSSQKLNFRSGYIGWTIKTKTPFMIGAIRNPENNITYYNKQINIQSLLIIPLLDATPATADDANSAQPTGVLVIDSKKPEAFNQQSKTVATIVAEKINSLLTTSNLLEVVSDSSEKLSSIYNYIQKLESSMDPNFILSNLFDTLKNTIPSDLVCITLKTGDISEVKFAGEIENSVLGMTFSHTQSLVGIVSTKNTPLNLADISDRSKFRDVFNKEIDLGLGMKTIKSSLLMPLSTTDEKTEDEIYGSVFIGSKTKNVFDEEQKNLAKILSQQAAKGIKYSLNLKNVKELAIKDGLSGLYNQKHFKEMLSNSIAKSQRFSEDLSLILMDIDNFKDVNDTYGHLAGDKIISEIGKGILNSLREIDISARYGGDEFAILLEKTNPAGAEIAAEKIKNSFDDRPILFNNESININFSIGIATYPENASSRDFLIEKADISLYEAKRNGKNQIIHFNDITEKNKKTIIDSDIPNNKNISLKD